MNESPTVKQQLLQQSIRPGLAKLPLPEGERMALTKKHTSVFTLIRPAATFSLEGEGIKRGALGLAARGCRGSVLECGRPWRFWERSKAVQRTALHDAGANVATPSPTGEGWGEGEREKL